MFLNVIAVETVCPNIFGVTMAGNVKINEAAIEEQILCLSNSQFKVEFETKTNNMLAKFKIKRIENKKEEQILLKYKCEQCDYTSDKRFNLKRHIGLNHNELR